MCVLTEQQRSAVADRLYLGVIAKGREMLNDTNFHKPAARWLESLCEIASLVLLIVGASALEQVGVSRYRYHCLRSTLQHLRGRSGTSCSI